MRRSRWLWLLCLLAFGGCAYELVYDGAINRSRADKVEQGIQSVRELSFKSRVPLTLKNRDDAERALIDDIHRDYSDEQLEADGQAGALIGLFPAGIDLKGEMLALLRSQIAAFYDPHSKQMIMIDGVTDVGLWGGTAEFLIQRDVVGEMLLAHELTHALQDQHFGLEAALDKIKNDDDRSLALKSVAEGDATLAGFGYVEGRMDAATVETVISQLSDLPQTFAAETQGVPEALSTPLIFQYSAGVRFVGEAFRRGGWPAVDALYQRPPESSQQIMHPALYFDRLTPPDHLRLAGYERILGDWTKVDDNCLGELQLQIILKRNLGKPVALADKWRGDRMVTMRKGPALTVLWMVEFSDRRSAELFTPLYASLLDQLLGARTPHRVESLSNAVLVLVGESARRAATLAPAVWAASIFEGAMPPLAPSSIRAAAPANREAQAGG